jgi:hypothetical protein
MARLAALFIEVSQSSTRGAITTVPDSPHDIQLARPQAVIDAIDSVREMAGQ